jgi:hypothetical protein
MVEISASHADLAGPVRALVTRTGEALRRRLEASDAENRARHGGRAPDFADPKPVMAALDMLTEELAAVAASTTRARMIAKLEPVPTVRVEITPEQRGTARDLMKDLPRGDLSLLRSLPSWVDLSVMWHRRESLLPFTDRISALFGDRIGSADRRRIAAWADELDRALGRAAVVGLYGDGAAAGVFVVATGDGLALRRATLGLADVAKVSALRAPIEAFWGRLKYAAREGALAGLPVIRVSLELSVPGAATPIRYGAVSATKGHRSAIVIGSGDMDARLMELIDDSGRISLGADGIVAETAARVQNDAAYAGSVRLRVGERGESEIAAWVAGTSDEAIWLDARASTTTLRALLSEDGIFGRAP